jgi:hypothetical protein
MTADTHAAAIDYAARGWPVLACHWTHQGACSCGWSGCPGPGKHPLFRAAHPKGSAERATCRGECGRLGHGVHDATTDPDSITAWWTRAPLANVGIATGAPGPDVVDFDTKKDAPGATSYATLRDAGMLVGASTLVGTPSGGWHLYFAGTTQGNGACGRHGVDFRGSGGYVLAPPSRIRDAPYTLIEQRDAHGAVDWQAIRHRLDPPRFSELQRVWLRRGGNYDGLIRRVAEQREGNRNSFLYWAAVTAVTEGADRAVLDELAQAAVTSGLTIDEATRAVESARKKTGATQ